MLRIFFFLFLAFNFIPRSAWAKKLIFLGDSLTEGYGVVQTESFPFLINEKFKADKSAWMITASGSSGSTSASTLSRLKWIAKEKPDTVFLLMGENDALRGLKVEETEKNLGEAIAWAQSRKIEIILGQLYAPPNYGKDYFKKFADIFPKLAKKYKVKLGPFLLADVGGIPALNQPDGIHPNAKGHKVVAEHLYQYLKKELK